MNDAFGIFAFAFGFCFSEEALGFEDFSFAQRGLGEEVEIAGGVGVVGGVVGFGGGKLWVGIGVENLEFWSGVMGRWEQRGVDLGGEVEGAH